ncbi:uncharacterized oxidoreductase-like [Lichtheimia corymbifera JMRC:FSU:9682]|uniref:Uncharacterized oxidoreductase-like n=1 Tax=Lichtheimia corymbifera JMRC:FSU:9682 TaxID=1263082 RepID=A0A068RKZ6_9FUNG|nr:uncharacterized oxidoreductase-like [Lichtheimia corymbifera JMRC:FSU:9682]
MAPVVLVTGCSTGGIGHGLCKQFAAKGCRVYATARKVENMTGLEGCELVALDVNDPASVNAAVERVISKEGHIDILVNNAGAPAIGPLMEIDLDMARRCVETNVFGTLAMCRAVGKHMAERGSGKIANVGSVVGYCSTPWAGIYALSKAAVHSMTDALRLELEPFGVQVVLVAPGSIKSNFGHAATGTVSIPEDSMYKSVIKHIYARATMSQGPGATPTDDFAAKVAGKLLGSPPRYITYGAKSLAFLLFYYLPFFVKDFVLKRMLGVNEVKRVK